MLVVGLMLTLPMVAAGASPPTTPVTPDARAALVATLAALEPHAPLTATYTVSKTRTSGDDDDDAPETTNGKLTVTIRSDAKGLHVDVPRSVLRTAHAESLAHDKNADAATPTLSLLNGFSLVSTQTLTDYASALQSTLTNAKLVAQSDVTRGGQAVHKLVFDIPLNVSADDRDNLDEYSGTLTVWLGADGVPQAVASTYSYTFSKFFISFTSTSKSTCTLTRIGSRLICSKLHSVNTGSGLGQDSKSVSDSRLQPIKVAASVTPAVTAPAGAAEAATAAAAAPASASSAPPR